MLRKTVVKHKLIIGIMALVICMASAVTAVTFAQNNSDEETISEGIYIGKVDVSGMNYEEALNAVSDYVNELSGSSIDLCIGENTVNVNISELGFKCDTQNVVEKALSLGKSGNIVKRYKEKKNLQENGSVISFPLEFSDDNIRTIIEEKCKIYEIQAENAGLKRVSGEFVITEGKQGVSIDIDASINAIKDYLCNEWDSQSASIALVTNITEPSKAGENLDKVGDLLATATTTYTKSGEGRCGNVERGASLINGTLLYPGDEFSTYETVGPISIENGYFMAASYENGQVVESPGGGICQVSTTLYNAVLKAELEVSQRSNHSMIVSYVDPSKDAAIAGTYKDFKFKNNTQYPIYIEGITEGKKITFNIYGVETRESSHSVEFVSETVQETEPTVVLTATADNLGYISTTQSPHKGIVAQLWKIVYENGVEVSKEVVNHSTYNMSPKMISIGTAGASAECMNELNAAIAANDEAAARSIVERYATAPPQTVDETASGAAVQEGVIEQPATSDAQQPDTQPATNDVQPEQQAAQ